MARQTNHMDLAPVLAAFNEWKARCLIEDGSIFSGARLWTPANIDEVRKAFVDHPDLGGDDFSTKLKSQMRSASTQAQQLMAEMLWALLLFPSNVNPKTKRHQIGEIWALSGSSLNVQSEMVTDAVLDGIGSGGPGFNNHRWRELAYLIGITVDLKRHDTTDRQAILTNYDRFMTWIHNAPQKGNRQYRHMLRYFCFPDLVERMSSNGDRRAILAAFGVATQRQTKTWSDRQLDEALLELRTTLQEESPTAVLDFYEAPLKERWKEDDEDEEEDEARDETQRYWVEKTITRNRPDRLSGEYAVGKALWSPTRDQRGADIYRFMRDVKVGDVVLHLTDNSAFTGVSIVASPQEEFSGVEGSDWEAGSSHYLVRLRDYRPLDPPLDRDVFFSEPVVSELTRLIDEGTRNLFYNREPSLNQGAYLTPAPIQLVQILDRAYRSRTGAALLDGLQHMAPVHSTHADEPVAVTVDLALTHQQFAEALLASKVSFGAKHEEITRSFLASLATKPFVILTGLSGSGKTQLALGLGDWMGAKKVVSVRPDWTGAEALFGYENAILKRSLDGRAAWEVPDTLRFMLRAVERPREPHVLILDEMNLAHVERYFADFLSGIESREPCLPDLIKDNEGYWRERSLSAPRLPIPRNLFVIGTVNVDETTYMFSPKVLDRANTFEFRVDTRDLLAESKRPIPVPPGDRRLTIGFLSVVTNDNWQLSHAAPRVNEFIENLQSLHSLLSKSGFEFGHRVFYEAVRYAAMLAACGEQDPNVALDFQLLQKVLPRLHGARRRLEWTLCAVGRFCVDLGLEQGDGSGSATFDPIAPLQADCRLPRSFDKIKRMTRSLRANQFVSFTE